MTMDWPNKWLIQNSSASITSDRQDVTVNKTCSELNSEFTYSQYEVDIVAVLTHNIFDFPIDSLHEGKSLPDVQSSPSHTCIHRLAHFTGNAYRLLNNI